MNSIYEMSGDYYARFFGAHLLPKWSNWRWMLCFASPLFIASFTYWLTVVKSPQVTGFFPLLILALSDIFLFVLACSPILVYSRDQELLQSSAPQTLSKPERLRMEKRKFLTELTKRPSSEFLTVAEEIAKLSELENAYRTPIDPDFFRILRKLCDPQFITSVIAIVLSALAIFLGLLDKSALQEISNSVSGRDSLKIFTNALIVVVAFGVLAVMIYTLIRQLVEIFTLFLASFTAKKFSNKTVLNCFIRDLISLHTPCQPHSRRTLRRPSVQPKPTPRLKRTHRSH